MLLRALVGVLRLPKRDLPVDCAALLVPVLRLLLVELPPKGDVEPDEVELRVLLEPLLLAPLPPPGSLERNPPRPWVNLPPMPPAALLEVFVVRGALELED